MRIEDFTQHANVTKNIAEAREHFAGREISDIVDDAGMQYVVLVMEGGGVLGIALVGYTYLLEQVGIRFLGIAGTSAGAINAVMLAATDTPAAAKSERLLEILCRKDLSELIDGDQDAREAIDALLNSRGQLAKAWKSVQVVDNLKERLGLNPGEEFLRWITAELEAVSIANMRDLKQRMETLPAGLRFRDGQAIVDADTAGSRLAIVATDVTTETKVIFPDMADLYFADPEAENPATFVRASMSVPFFFEPAICRDLPRTPGLAERWNEAAGIEFEGAVDIPDEVMFIDGGAVSNFPIAIFHMAGKVPPAPTLGAKLGQNQRRHQIGGPVDLLEAMFFTASNCLDYDFISKNPDYCHLVAHIPIEKFNWLDFQMSDDTKIELFEAGVIAAAQFLRQFDWQAYKQVRAGLVPSCTLPAAD